MEYKEFFESVTGNIELLERFKLLELSFNIRTAGGGVLAGFGGCNR